MLQTSTDKPLILPYVLIPETGDPDPPGGTGDPPPPGIKPPTNQQQGNVGGQGDIKPPTATDTPDAEPPDTADDSDPPIIVSGGGGNS